MWCYQLFRSWFNWHYILKIRGKGLNPSYIFNRSIIRFGTAICSYMKRWEKKVSIGLTLKQVMVIILDHICHKWQDLLGAFEQLLRVDASEVHWFLWNGPQFHILSQPQGQAWTELQDLPEDPVYEDL